jgi:hypothetical protein
MVCCLAHGKIVSICPIELNWSNIAITVLGCRLGNDGKKDWGSLVLWKQCQLLFRGRALVANVLGLSFLWYQAQIFDVPKTVIFQVNKILFIFVWRKQREWMTRTSVIQPRVDGGLGVVRMFPKKSCFCVRSGFVGSCLIPLIHGRCFLTFMFPCIFIIKLR